MRTTLIDASAQIVRMYTIVWGLYITATLFFGREKDPFFIEGFFPLIVPVYLSSTGWLSFWRRVSSTIRQFWIGVVLVLLFGVLCTYAISAAFALVHDGRAFNRPRLEDLMNFVFVLSTMLIIQMNWCYESQRNSILLGRGQMQLAKRYLVFFPSLGLLILVGRISGLLTVALFEVMLLTALFLSNGLMVNSVPRLTRFRMLYAGTIAIATLLTICLVRFNHSHR